MVQFSSDVCQVWPPVVVSNDKIPASSPTWPNDGYFAARGHVILDVVANMFVLSEALGIASVWQRIFDDSKEHERGAVLLQMATFEWPTDSIGVKAVLFCFSIDSHVESSGL